MSLRLVLTLAMAAIVALAAGASWILVQPKTVPQAGGDTAKPTSDAARREHREKFFSGDPARNIRGGQEMKPRW
ncbi:entry exclusion protein TrbK [Rhizobium aegyptiacum]|uniref:entry exclusion protein TrbK n=1 Tax=Rhizobium aegyptiacum TaxID=1764550 RepID=UPI0007E55F1B|nr:entry exclusion protein TrbK [Rhizobium aegyptiacum]